MNFIGLPVCVFILNTINLTYILLSVFDVYNKWDIQPLFLKAPFFSPQNMKQLMDSNYKTLCCILITNLFSKEDGRFSLS